MGVGRHTHIKMPGLKLFAPVALVLLALTPLAWTAVPQASYLVHLEVKTDNGLNSGMDAFGSIDVRIYNENDVFCVDDLKNCFLFYIPDNNVTKITVQHHGLDAWLPEYFQMHMDPSAVIQCNDGEWIDNEELHTIKLQHYLETE